MNKNRLTPIYALLLIGLSLIFGLQGQPTQMGIFAVAGAIALAFLNSDKIQKLKGAGFEAEMKKAVVEANATIEQPRKVATTSGEVTLTSPMAGNFMSGMALENRLKLHRNTWWSGLLF